MVATKKKKKKGKKKRKLTPEEKQARRAKQIADAAANLRESYRGVKVTVRQMPYSKTFTTEQKRRALTDFEASTDAVSMSKKLVDAKEPAVQRVREVVAAINAAYTNRKYTLPHPERGLRLIKQGCYTEDDPEVESGIKKAGEPGKYMERLHRLLTELSDDLQRAAVALEAEMPAIREREKERQGKLYDPDNYRFDAATAFRVDWQFVDVDVPSYLMQLDPELQRMAERRRDEQLELACRMKEEEMAEELFLALDALIERLSGTRDGGKAKIFRNDTAGKLCTFIDEAGEQLRENGIGKGPLQRAFKQLKEVVRGENEDTLADHLRDSDEFRGIVREGAEAIANSVLANAVIKPKRKILRQRAVSTQLHRN